MERSDAELAQAAAAGSADAFREILRRYERPVYGLLLRMVRQNELAEDLAQETFLKAYRALASYDPRRKFSSWLFKIAHNTAIDQLRRRELDTVPLESSEEGEEPRELPADPRAVDPEREAERRHLARAFEAALGELREEYREAVLLRYQEGLAYEEIAEVMALPLGTVKTHLFRARQELARLMARRGWGDRPPAESLKLPSRGGRRGGWRGR